MTSTNPATPFWEQSYQDPSASSFGESSHEIITLSWTLNSGASVLDLGCGEGRNALFLAGRGFDVSAVDISSHGIDKLRLLAQQRGIQLRSEIADMRSYPIQMVYDLIISHGCLHLIARDDWQKVLNNIKSHTAIGGYNVVAVFTDRIAPPPDLEAFCLGLFREGELFTHYSDWKIHLQDSYTFHDEHPGGIRHTHPINKIVAQRIG